MHATVVCMTLFKLVPRDCTLVLPSNCFHVLYIIPQHTYLCLELYLVIAPEDCIRVQVDCEQNLLIASAVTSLNICW